MLAAACAYDGQDKSEKGRIIEGLLSQVKTRPVMDLSTLTSSEKLTELFTADIHEAKLKTDEVCVEGVWVVGGGVGVWRCT